MPKNNRHGQASLFSEGDYVKILKNLTNPKYRLFLQIARYTGERWGAIAQLKVEDVYRTAGEPHEYLTFRASTRKASPDGTRETRQVPIHENLLLELKGYKSPVEGWLFPGRGGGHLSFDSADNFLRQALELAGLNNRGFSTHSTRRTLITKLARSGIAARVIQKVTGHKDMKTLQRYIDVSDEQVREAIALI